MLLIEKITAAWWTLTTLAVLVLWRWLADPVAMMLTHVQIAMCVGLSWAVGRSLMRRGLREEASPLDKTPRLQDSKTQKLPSLGLLLRVGTPLAMLALWYGETYAFCSLLPYRDHVFAAADQWLCGLQPSIAFSESLSEGWCGIPEGVFSELFNLGYWSYYPMQLVVILYYFFAHRHETARVAAVILATFFTFYIIYFVLPVGGPQFYFEAIGLDQARDGVFPATGHYLATHRDMLPAPGWTGGLFYRLVSGAQSTGEFPTAAFPSSHIGCTVVFLGLALRRSRRLFLCMLPFALLLACATVYIQAHYLVDAIAGLVAGVLVYQLLTRTVLLPAR